MTANPTGGSMTTLQAIFLFLPLYLLGVCWGLDQRPYAAETAMQPVAYPLILFGDYSYARHDEVEGDRHYRASLKHFFGDTSNNLFYAAIAQALAEKMITHHKYAEATPYLEKVLQIRTKARSAAHQSMRALAALYDLQKRYADADSLYLKTLRIQRRTFSTRNLGATVTCDLLAERYENQGRFTEAESLLTENLELVKQVLGPEHQETAWAAQELSSLYRKEGRYKEAESSLQAALQIEHKYLRKDHGYLAVSAFTMSEICRDLGRCKEARSLCEETLRIVRKTIGPDSLTTAQEISLLAALDYDEGHYAEAEAGLTELLSIQKKRLGETNPLTAATDIDLARTRLAQGRADTADPQALAIINAEIQKAGTDGTSDRHNLGLYYFQKGEYSKAEKQLTAALNISSKLSGPEHPDVLRTMYRLADTLRLQGRLKEAEALSLRTLDLRVKVLGPCNGETARTRNLLGQIFEAEGDYQKASVFYEEALKEREQILGADATLTLESKANLRRIAKHPYLVPVS